MERTRNEQTSEGGVQSECSEERDRDRSEERERETVRAGVKSVKEGKGPCKVRRVVARGGKQAQKRD